jgi:hypothetical protein
MSIKKRLLLFVMLVFSQCVRVYAQDRGARMIEEQFKEYRRQAFNEKLFLHTDKNFYLAGEVLWFKLYYVDGSFHKPIDLSKLAYIEILDRDDKPMLQSKIALSQGAGNGSLFLPVSLNSGVYRLRAYTQWMKNSPADYFFEKPVTIVNSIKTLGPPVQQRQAYDIGFFPEGGNLVQDIESKLAFRIVDGSGRGVQSRGIIVNQNNDTITTFQPLKFGLGHCMFTPKGGNSYKAVININDTVLERELPAIQQQGYVLNVSEEGESKLRVRVTSNLSATDAVYLLVHSRQIIKLSEEKLLSGGSAIFIVEKEKLGDGISHFTHHAARLPFSLHQQTNQGSQCPRIYRFPSLGPRAFLLMKTWTYVITSGLHLTLKET